jgi:replication factor C subunit 3/5
MAALLKLSKGDMRRALNILQACHAAYDTTTEAEVYNCTGNPHPSDIDVIIKSMMSDEFTTSYDSMSFHSAIAQFILNMYPEISKMKLERGLALQDFIAGAFEYIDGIDFPPQTRVYLLDHLATTE